MLLLITGICPPTAAALLLDRHQSAGIGCPSCHKETPPHVKPADSVCLGCHGDQAKLAQLTSKDAPNPHAPPHLAPGETQACDDCHHVHRASELSCVDCHHSFQLDVK